MAQDELREKVVQLIHEHTDHAVWDEETLADSIISAFPGTPAQPKPQEDTSHHAESRGGTGVSQRYLPPVAPTPAQVGTLVSAARDAMTWAQQVNMRQDVVIGVRKRASIMCVILAAALAPFEKETTTPLNMADADEALGFTTPHRKQEE